MSGISLDSGYDAVAALLVCLVTSSVVVQSPFQMSFHMIVKDDTTILTIKIVDVTDVIHPKIFNLQWMFSVVKFRFSMRFRCSKCSSCKCSNGIWLRNLVGFTFCPVVGMNGRISVLTLENSSSSNLMVQFAY